MNREQIQERIEKCHEIMGANPDSQIFAALAEAYRKLGDLKSALSVCNEGLRSHANYGSAHLVLAKVARDQRRFKDAEQSAFKAIELDGRTRSAEILLSDIYLQTGKFGKAEELLNDLEQADPSNESVVRLRDLVRKARQLAEMSGSGGVLVRGSATGVFLTTAAEPRLVPVGAAPQVNAAVSTHDPPDVPVPTPAEMTWESVFASLEEYPHLEGKLATAYDGILLDSDLETRSEAESMAAMAAELFTGIRGDWVGTHFGFIEHMFIETAKSSWLLWPFKDFLLLLWCDPGINLGPLRMRLQHQDPDRAAHSYGGTA